jgi:hypothetical protein
VLAEGRRVISPVESLPAKPRQGIAKIAFDQLHIQSI